MYAVRQYEFGSPDTLRYERVADPEPGPGQVRIAVTAAAAYPHDIAVRSSAGNAARCPLPELPVIPGHEVAGTVDAVGAGVDGAWLGRRVVTQLGLASGGYAELVVREVAALHAIPDGLDDAVAVAVLGAGRAALGILDVARPGAGDIVLVTAAASGVGTLLVQAACGAGATVAGAAGGPDELKQVRLAGADLAVDRSSAGWCELLTAQLYGRRPTIVVDGVGGQIGCQARDLLEVGGRLVVHGWSSGTPTEIGMTELYERELTASVISGGHPAPCRGGVRALEERALAEAARGTLDPVVRRHPLRQAAQVQAGLSISGAAGAVVFVP
ncbi:alcohol dehydrogenase catalytic domain-containing protein [Haloechinothrix sp. LS1_15]|uniref:alcohol dehydrogenase catalytic domain-containing protein n=1 Tax=Haloechinothrix sp. LS1_15 TaxID=2652248 RepID=UPI00294754F9|nr:zinc-binding dehydrogenase [Haloechinothrix sp. LS1_15]MDV6011610.1 zinc-binding dehydrogenase [Haloechinothrix sp. LS1_15]